ncbi:hypothetical protein CLOP_g12518 [Closterium sp. NIES-67]|nr:hypothetical protein CLOP_g12518 [Closterium sp. NIES-67]
MLRAFGCMVVFHVPKEKRGKLEASGRWSAGSVVEQIEEDEIAHCYWAPIPEPKTREEALNGPNGEKWKATCQECLSAWADKTHKA